MSDNQKTIIDSISFSNKTVLITGAASGIGRSIAKRFAEADARLILLDLDTEGLEVTQKEISNKNAILHTIDLANKAEIENIWSNLNEDDLPDVLINNAGIYPIKDYLEVDEDYLKKTLDVNMNSAFWMCQSFIKLRGKKGGVIVNTSSIEAILPFKQDLIHYSVSKAGVIALTRSLARDYGSLGFRANVVMPGAIKTPGTDKLVKNAIYKVKANLLKTGYDFQQRLASGRWGEPDEVAKVVLFLSSDLASYVQGAVIPVDGGFLSS